MEQVHEGIERYDATRASRAILGRRLIGLSEIVGGVVVMATGATIFPTSPAIGVTIGVPVMALGGALFLKGVAETTEGKKYHFLPQKVK